MLSLSSQGKGDILTMGGENLEKGSLEMFQSLCDFASENGVNAEQIKGHYI